MKLLHSSTLEACNAVPDMQPLIRRSFTACLLAGAPELTVQKRAQVKLSSAAVPDEKANDTIVIGPPFYLELHLGGLPLWMHNIAHYRVVCIWAEAL